MNMYEKAVIKVAHIEEKTNLLGPYDRFVIWVHGCCFNCKGCIAVNTKSGSYDEMDVDVLAHRIVSSSCEGITVSGGEPFLQTAALLELFRKIKLERDIGIIVYSGFTLEEVQKDVEKSRLLPYIDILIDGRYVQELDDGRAYVGSSNQVIHYLTVRYITEENEYYAASKRRAEIKFTSNRAVLIGIPSKSVLKVWQDIKEKSGGMHNDF